MTTEKKPNKPFREGTPLNTILDDGWSRGLHILQTYREAHEMGYSIHLEEIHERWEWNEKQFKLATSPDPKDRVRAEAMKLDW